MCGLCPSIASFQNLKCNDSFFKIYRSTHKITGQFKFTSHIQLRKKKTNILWKFCIFELNKNPEKL